MELWTWKSGLGDIAGRAAAAEVDGWDGIALGDNQSRLPDPFVELAVAATTTTRVKLGTAVTNPGGRIPAVMAAAAASVQAESGGRVVLGIGRGDSALANLGLGPVPVAVFDRYLERLQGYLRGDAVPFDRGADGHGEVPPVSVLGTSSVPTSSRLQWLPPNLPKVPIDVAASGPRMIAIAGRRAESVTLALGLAPQRLRWGVDLARAARADAGLDSPLVIGTYTPIVVHDDRARARDLASGMAGSVARFSVMHGQVSGPIDARHAEILRSVHRVYDMSRHFTYGSPQSRLLDDEMLDAWAIAGPPSYCAERILELADLGITKVFCMDAGQGVDQTEVDRSRRRLVDEVLPAVRDAA